MYSVLLANINDSTKLVKFHRNFKYLTYTMFIKKLNNPLFVDRLKFALNMTKFNHYMIKSTILSNSILDHEFEFNITRTEFASKIADYTKFMEYMDTRQHFAIFKSLSGNMLLVPHPYNGESDKDNYKHYLDMAGFLKYAPDEKIKLFWKNIKIIASNLLKENKRFYMQTIGHDVPYFHFRFVII